ncbi:MAG: hypothetical protein NXY57DRAFT_958681 [Lentinula lateritia]|uniref:Uncharacterized protein n=1 Tax=Lentinula lateritia TaxID=40482 RepID=A0ABQ8V0I2_9AGAR|nr:MAG: hypothetical protein NXY57DRAFT_958681 [Lentinula lateritia]KAJ4468055.1 hypothetical protein C8R41DRAFT_925450 [Lentinula lateritia]
MDLRRRSRTPFKRPRRVNSGLQYRKVITSVSEQEEVIESLREETAKSNKRSTFMMRIVVLSSAFLHLIYFANLDPTDGTIPLPRPFIFVSLALHANLMLLLDPTAVRDSLLLIGVLNETIDLGKWTLSLTLAYSLAFVAPAVCLFLRHSWLSVACWSITPLITYAVQSVLEAAATGNEHIRSLEALKYTAPGA